MIHVLRVSLLVGCLCVATSVEAAVVTRYFSTTGAGAADGTTWADRAELDPAGTWSSVILLFAFNGSDSMLACIGPGTYTFSVGLTSGLFTNAPTVPNLLFFHGCDGSGNLLAPADADWMSNWPDWTDAALPVLATTTNIATTSLTNATWSHLKFTASGRNGAVIAGGFSLDWCIVINSTANTSATAASFLRSYGSIFKATGTSYDSIVTPTGELFNSRVEGNASASSGNRRGVVSTSGLRVYYSTIVNNVGEGILSTASGTGFEIVAERCTVANNGAAGIKGNATASQTVQHKVLNSMITGNGTYGVDGSSAAYLLALGNRLRDNPTANLGNLLNYPTTFNNYTTDSDDSTEYVSVAGGDFRIKNTAAIWGQGYGVSDEPAAATGFKNFLGGQ